MKWFTLSIDITFLTYDKNKKSQTYGENLKMIKTKINKLTISTICLLFFSLLLISTTLQITQGTTSISLKETLISPNPSVQYTDLYTDFWETAWVWVSSDGWLNARAEINSKDLGFGEQNLNLFIASYHDVYDLFDHANWQFWQTDNPGDQNTEVTIQFRTTNAELAKEYADLIVEYMSKGLLINYEYEGTWGWEDWRDDRWIDLTAVRYRSHIVWPWFTEFINDEIIPRDIGGLAETINVTKAGHINAWAWPQGSSSNPEIGFAFGFEFYHDIIDITGAYSGYYHTLTLNDLINTEKIQKVSNQDRLWINYALPNVTLLTSTPSNDSLCNVYHKYHPPQESWVTHHYWDVDFEIDSGIYTALSVGFNYDFIPHYLQTRIDASITVNHYGYLQKDIYLQGDYSRVIDFESPTVTTNWDPNIGIMEIYFRPNTYGLTNNTFDLTIVYNDTADHYEYANNIAMDIETYLGIDFTDNHTEHNWWDWRRLRYEGNTYRFHAEDFTSVISQNLLSSSDVISSSPVFEYQDTATSEYHQLSYYHPDVGQWIDQIDFRWNPLAEEVITPIKTYSSGSPVNIDLELLTEWGWSSFPHCSNYSVSGFPIVVPYDAYTVYPRENNGWGWHTDTWEEHWFHDIRYVHHNLEIYTDAASLEFVDEYGEANGTALTEFGLEFDYTFLEDDVDTQPPNGNFYYCNFTADEEYWGNDIQNRGVTFSGVDNHLHVRVWDDNSHGVHNFWWPYEYWDGTDWEPRFGSSGLKETTVKAYFAELPAEVAQFERDIPLTIWWDNYPTRDYNLTWDTTDGFADGEWTLIAYSEDNDGNWVDFGVHSLLVDNYDAAATDAPVINLLTAENTTVFGTHTIKVQVTDNVEVFAVVLTRDFTAYLLNDTDDDDIYEFNWNTLGEAENSIHYFTITVWDMEGHKVIYDFYLQVDNIRPGDPPTVAIISPSIAGETLIGSYTFQVEVIDDLGIQSVKMQIDEGPTYSMTFNPTTGYYERTHDLTKEINGERILHIIVIDIDENQHTEHREIAFVVVGGQEGPTVSDPPEWSLSHSDLPENLSDYVEAGNLNDYEPVSGDIDFKVAVKDDRQITTVGIKIQIVNDFDPVTGEPDLGIVVEDTSMDETGTTLGWSIYEYSWDSTAEADNYYLCEIDVQDDDTVVNHLYISVLIQVDNVEDTGEAPVIGGAPGFEFEVLLFSLTSVYLITLLIKRRRK